MNDSDKIKVAETVESEGFHYAFYHYSDFKKIKDEQFHKLRTDYLKTAKALADYCGLEDI